MKLIAGLLTAFAVIGSSDAACTEPQPDLGRAAFDPCLACHALDPSVSDLAGPNLAGLIGRPVAGDINYAYSPVLEAAGDDGLIWTPERLKRFLADPEGMFPGMWMSYRGIDDEKELEALADFIAAHE